MTNFQESIDHLIEEIKWGSRKKKRVALAKLRDIGLSNFKVIVNLVQNQNSSLQEIGAEVLYSLVTQIKWREFNQEFRDKNYDRLSRIKIWEELKDLFKSNNDQIKIIAAIATSKLGRIKGTDQKEVLKRIMKDSSSNVQKNIRFALVEIDQKPIKIFKKLPVKVISFFKYYIPYLPHYLKELFNQISYFITDSLIPVVKRKYFLPDFISFILGIKPYTKMALLTFNEYYRSEISINEQKRINRLPNNAPCKNCGIMLSKPPPYMGSVFSCPKCACHQTFAETTWDKITVNLIRERFFFNPKLRKKFRSFYFKEYL